MEASRKRPRTDTPEPADNKRLGPPSVSLLACVRDCVSRWKTEVETQAASGHIESQYLLGEMHRKGYAGPPNLALAVEWFSKAARYHPEAALRLGNMYHSGSYSFPRNPEIAFFYFLVASRRGDESAKYLRDLVRAEISPRAAQDIEAQTVSFLKRRR
eukprot:GILJ01010889.1.p1 GENE.GILJ01010889.1~~GILJ01010889.1.p1  ORF type:complete len:158 (+),score=9.68 GILJ01010889.1:104-577(+)